MSTGRWTTLGALREGAIFETRDGIRAVKSEYHYTNGGCECVLLASGEYAHFGGGKGTAVHNAEQVREIDLPAPTVDAPPGQRLRPELATTEEGAARIGAAMWRSARRTEQEAPPPAVVKEGA